MVDRPEQLVASAQEQFEAARNIHQQRTFPETDIANPRFDDLC